jgi:uncharacterized membrane protein
LLAVSPFHLYYAQIARQYSLWTLFSLLASAALLWSIRSRKKKSWILYFVFTLLNLYTSALSILTLFAQALYMLWLKKLYPKLKIRYFLISGLISIALFSIWFVVCSYDRGEQATEIVSIFDDFWEDRSVSKIKTLQYLGLHISKIFVMTQNINLALLIVVLIVTIQACFTVIKKYKCNAKILVALTIFLSIFPLVMDDLLDGGVVTKNSRYFVPALIMILVLMASFIVYLKSSGKELLERYGEFLFASLIILGLWSSFSLKSLDAYESKHVPSVSEYINVIENPIVYTSSLHNLFAVAEKSTSDTRFVFYRKAFEQISTDDVLKRNVYIFEPNQNFSEYIENGLGLKMNSILGSKYYLFQVALS